jgi:trehalose 6-phosphate synthase
VLASLATPGTMGRVVEAASLSVTAFVGALGTARRTARRSAETDAASEPGPWTASRLRAALAREFAGERVIVVANREPVIHELDRGTIVERHPASGLVTALEPIVRTCAGVWVAHGSGAADRETADDHGRFRVAGESPYVLRRVWLTPTEERGYYYGFANEALWPLCHLAHAQPVFRRSDFTHYRTVNQRFADAVSTEITSDEPVILVQDYHFALVPEMLRERFPRATILTFWHIPWPNAERFSICPYERELLNGLLGSSILGFQTPLHGRNFLDTVDRSLESCIEWEDTTVACRGHATAVRSYPISVDWPGDTPGPIAVARVGRAVRARLGIPDGSPLVVCVDRLDYTKGFEERLQSFGRLLERAEWRERRPVLLQIAAPSRDLIERYRQFGSHVGRLVEEMNRRFGSGAYQPVLFVHRHCPRSEVVDFYRAADACYVSSLHDGMNLVAKEFVAARADEDGVLLLSRFAGAARELTEALIVNPYDIDGVADVMADALTMPVDERRVRMKAMRAYVEEHNVYRWAGAMLTEASALRRQRQLRSRLADRA